MGKRFLGHRDDRGLAIAQLVGIGGVAAAAAALVLMYRGWDAWQYATVGAVVVGAAVYAVAAAARMQGRNETYRDLGAAPGDGDVDSVVGIVPEELGEELDEPAGGGDAAEGRATIRGTIVAVVTEAGPGGIDQAAISERLRAERTYVDDKTLRQMLEQLTGPGGALVAGDVFGHTMYSAAAGQPAEATPNGHGPGGAWQHEVQALARTLSDALQPNDLHTLGGRGIRELVRDVAPLVPGLNIGEVESFVRDYVERLAGQPPTSGINWHGALEQVRPAWSVRATTLDDLDEAIVLAVGATRTDGIGTGPLHNKLIELGYTVARGDLQQRLDRLLAGHRLIQRQASFGRYRLPEHDQ